MSSDFPSYGAVLAKNIKLDQTGIVFHNTSDDSKTVTLKLATGAMSAGNVDLTLPLSATALGGGGSTIPDGDTAGDALLWSGSAWVQKAVSGDATIDANGALTLANGSVEGSMLAVGAVNASNKLGAGVVDATALAANACTSAKIQAGAIDNSNKFGAGVVDANALAANACTSAKIQAGAIDNSNKFGAGVVDASALGSDACTTVKIADDAVTNAKLATNSVNADSCGITTAGVAEASKCAVLDAQKDLTGLRELGCAEVQVATNWKMKVSGNNLVFQYWNGSAWATRQTFTPS